MMNLEQDYAARKVVPPTAITYLALSWGFAGTDNAFNASTNDFFIFTMVFFSGLYALIVTQE